MDNINFQRLSCWIFSRPDIATALANITDHTVFEQKLLDLATEAGITITDHELLSVRQQLLQRWIERWI